MLLTSPGIHCLHHFSFLYYLSGRYDIRDRLEESAIVAVVGASDWTYDDAVLLPNPTTR